MTTPRRERRPRATRLSSRGSPAGWRALRESKAARAVLFRDVGTRDRLRGLSRSRIAIAARSIPSLGPDGSCFRPGPRWARDASSARCASSRNAIPPHLLLAELALFGPTAEAGRSDARDRASRGPESLRSCVSHGFPKESPYARRLPRRRTPGSRIAKRIRDTLDGRSARD
jgi:hypothetical protein